MVRQAVAVVLVAFLAFPTWSASPVVGTVARSTGATSGGTVLQSGSTVFSGDVVEVSPTGAAWIALEGGARVQISSATQVRLERSGEKVSLELGRGRVAFRAGSGFEARLGDATVRAAGSAATGHVYWTEERRALIASEKGELIVTAAGSAKSITLREGEGVEVTLEPAPAPQVGNPANANTLSRRWVVILGLIVGVTVTAIAIALNRGETEISQRDRGNEISPFKFP